MKTRIMMSVAACLVVLAPGMAMAQSLEPVGTRGGFNVNVYVTAGQPFVSGSAGDIWDAVGGLGIVPGFGARLGYRWYRIGFEGGIDLMGSNPRDREGAGVGANLMALFRFAPEHRFDPTLGVGYVRELISADFRPGEFPLAAIRKDLINEQPSAGGEQATVANGFRMNIGGAMPLTSNLDLTVDAVGDFLWFGTAVYQDGDYSTRESGLSVWPRLGVGVRWDP